MKINEKKSRDERFIDHTQPINVIQLFKYLSTISKMNLSRKDIVVQGGSDEA